MSVEVVNPNNPLSGHIIKKSAREGERFRTGGNGGELIGATMRGTGKEAGMDTLSQIATAPVGDVQGMRETPRSAAARNFARQASTTNALTLAQKNACNLEESNMQKCFKRMTIESDGEVSKCQSYADQFKQCRLSSGLATISEDGELKMKKQNQTFAGISQYVGGMW